MISALVTIGRGGAIAKTNLQHNMERSGLTKLDVDFEQEQAELQAEEVL